MYEKLLKIQQELNVPKNRRNTFGNYNYRNCDDILEAVKPLCVKHNAVLGISDEVIEIGGRVFVKATARIVDIELDKELREKEFDVRNAYRVDPIGVDCYGWAEIATEKKGMDVAQITGAASSYARKYALNGLFAIDDEQDADATNTHDKEKSETPTNNNNFTI